MPEYRDVLIPFILLTPDKFQKCFMRNEKTYGTSRTPETGSESEVLFRPRSLGRI